jgi:hypothetical protein
VTKKYFPPSTKSHEHARNYFDTTSCKGEFHIAGGKEELLTIAWTTSLKIQYMFNNSEQENILKFRHLNVHSRMILATKEMVLFAACKVWNSNMTRK